MAAKGMVPLKGGDLILLLCQLSGSEEEQVKKSALDTLGGMPENVLLGGLSDELHPAALNAVSRLSGVSDAIRERLATHPLVADDTLIELAKRGSDQITETIALNQARLLAAPKIVEALYMNPKARMSTIDRLVELCARNGVELTGIPSYAAHVEAIKGQLIPEPEPDAEPLPSDTAFAELAEEDNDSDIFETDVVEKTESVKEQFKPLLFRVRDMSLAEKVRLATIGGRRGTGALDPRS